MRHGCLFIVYVMAAVAIAHSDAGAAPVSQRFMLQLDRIPSRDTTIARLSGWSMLQDRRHRGGNVLKLKLGPATGAVGWVIPDPIVRDRQPHEATLVLPRGAVSRQRVTVTRLEPAPTRPLVIPYTVTMATAAIGFVPGEMGGMPTSIRWLPNGPELKEYTWNDRIHTAAIGSYSLRNDRKAEARILLETEDMTVVRSSARYCAPDGTPAPDGARAVYDWYFDRRLGTILCQGWMVQARPTRWEELHHLELNVASAFFDHWASREAPSGGTFTASMKSLTSSGWGSMSGSGAAIGLAANTVRFYDGRGEYGTYLHGYWQPWATSSHATRAVLSIGAPTKVDQMMEKIVRQGAVGRVVVTTASFERMIAPFEKPDAAPSLMWRGSIARRLLEQGKLPDAEAVLRSASEPKALATSTVRLVRAGDAAAAFDLGSGGIRLLSLYDLGRRTEIAASRQPPILSISATYRNSDDAQSCSADSDQGWKTVRWINRRGGFDVDLRDHEDTRFRGISVTLKARGDAKAAAWSWDVEVANTSERCGIERISYPSIVIRDLGADTIALYPTGPGVLRSVHSTTLDHSALYPNGWCTMQLMAVYAPRAGTGLYYAFHDPGASAKEIRQRWDDERTVYLAFETPTPEMGVAGRSYRQSGVAIWRLLRGDWFDAARIYRSWVIARAPWYPRLGAEGRTDTPEWLKRLNVWAQTGGAPADCVEPVKGMQRTLGVPIGFHWYNWHQIPFDNDYPHYFPTRDGVSEAVADLQSSGVRVMPYINGRLWDTRDRGATDFEFTSVAAPAATKNSAGEPVIETYGSKEADGSPVRLAVMCPTTPLWQNKVREIVLRLMTEVGVQGVYIDQIAAAAPALCMDASHGHPLGGGSWWTTLGYWPLLQRIREAMPSDRFITTECAAEPYAAYVDALLTWDWQHDGMVPMLPAIYGGAVQYFGRNYAAGATTHDLALCMKIGQQLVFGEQIGWMNPAIAAEPVAGAFLRDAVRLRDRFVSYFAQGEMARPPVLRGSVPMVKADWAWYGETWVSTPAVLTGAWRLPYEKRLLLIFANVQEQNVRCEFHWSASTYGLPGAGLTVTETRTNQAEADPAVPIPARAVRRFEVTGRSIYVMEIRWK